MYIMYSMYCYIESDVIVISQYIELLHHVLLSSACSISSSREYKSVDTDNYIILRFILLRITGLGCCTMLSCLIF